MITVVGLLPHPSNTLLRSPVAQNTRAYMSPQSSTPSPPPHIHILPPLLVTSPLSLPTPWPPIPSCLPLLLLPFSISRMLWRRTLTWQWRTTRGAATTSTKESEYTPRLSPLRHTYVAKSTQFGEGLCVEVVVHIWLRCVYICMYVCMYVPFTAEIFPF